MARKKYPKPPHYIIYGLFDPRDGSLRYIGQTRKGLERARDHMRPSVVKDKENPRNSNWILKLKELGLRPEVDIIEEVSSEEGLDESEIFHIAYFRSIGCDLHNVLDGGNKPPRHENSPEFIEALIARNKLREYPKGFKHSEETKERIRVANLGKHSGRFKTEEEKIAMAIKKGGSHLKIRTGIFIIT